MAETVDGWLAEVDDPERDLAAAVLEFVRATLEDAEETVKWNQPCWVVAGANCLYVSAQDGYVNLGFYDGAALDDSAGLLEGTGKRMRHVKVRSADALADDALSELVAAAEAHARS